MLDSPSPAVRNGGCLLFCEQPQSNRGTLKIELAVEQTETFVDLEPPAGLANAVTAIPYCPEDVRVVLRRTERELSPQ
jgi:hypothetical protein